MNIEQHVPKLSTCQKLQDAGWKGETIFTHWNNRIVHNGCYGLDAEWYPAPLLSELLEVLLFKEQMMDIHIQVSKTEEYTATVFFSKNYQGMGDNPAEAAAQLVLTLVEEGILTL